MTRRLLFVLTLLGAPLAAAPAAPATPPAPAAAPARPEMSGDESHTDPTTGEQILTGHARIVQGNALLTADEIRFHLRTNTATARGHVELTRGPLRYLGDEIIYRFSARTFTVKGIRLGQFPLYINGDSAEGTLKEITVTNATVFYHEPTLLGPSLRANKILYIPGERIRAERVHVGLGSVRPLSLLTLDQNLHEPIISLLEVHGGYTGNLGAYLGVGLHAPVLPGVDFGGDIAFYTRRGFLAGPSGSYDIHPAAQNITGSVKTGYIHDNGKKLTDILGRRVPPDRGFIDWQHSQTVGENLFISGQAHYWSDSEIIRDFVPEEFYPVQQPDTFLEGTYVGRNAIVSLFARAQPNAYYRVQQRLPELRFDLLPTPIGQGIYQRASASAAVLRDNAVLSGQPSIHSERFDAYYGLERPTSPREWLTFNPVAGARVTHYASAIGGKNNYTRILGEIGADASLRASGVYTYKNERWQIDGIRHLITPRLAYRYIPKADRGRRYIPVIDDRVFTTYLQPLGLGDQRATDDLRATNVLRFGWDNTFQTRDKTYGSRDLLTVNFAADLDLDAARGQREFSAIHSDLAFTPVNWFRFDLYESTTPQDLTLQELNAALQINDGDAWSFRISNHYLRRQIQEFAGEGRYRLNEAYQAYLRAHFDSRKSRFVEQSFGLVQNISNLWTVRYGVSIYDGPRRESGFGFNIEVRLAGF